VSCLDVRDLLPELAVGVLPPEDRAAVELHLRGCAGCRKEAGELGNAAAAIAFALEPAPMPEALRTRVVDRIRRAAGAPGTTRRLRAAAAGIIAAMVAVSGLGWGAVMAGRADRFERRAEEAELDRAAALAAFGGEIEQLLPGEIPLSETHLAQLAPATGESGGGAVLQLVSPTLLDFAIVIVKGLDPSAEDRLPYRVRLLNAVGAVLKVGRITELDAEGGAEVFHEFVHAELTGYTIVEVVDASGAVVLAGEVDQRT
jgi:hypothetical protein